MIRVEDRPQRFGLEAHGLTPTRDVFWNLPRPALIEHALAAGEGQLAASGAFATTTGKHTGRSPNDRFIVREPPVADDIWWGDVNVALDRAQFDLLHDRMRQALAGRDLYVRDAYAGADRRYRLPVRVISTGAWYGVFVANMFRAVPEDERPDFDPRWTVLHAPDVTADPAQHGTHSETFVVISFAERVVLIGGTAYAGEIKKSIFSAMNYLLPERDVLPMHCSANVGADGDVALFFGLSGTGKTTLSASDDRRLIGDDEHGWSPHGVFNFEGGSYAKVIRLSEASEPQIYRATEQFGSILENVVIDPVTRRPCYDDDTITENTRSSYPLSHLESALEDSMGAHPRNVVFLTADAFGVLPPISRLDREQGMYHFLSGYTAKVAGTERGVSEPKATFSACFGAPFLPRHPAVYAEQLGQRVEQHDARVWLVNTGWTGGPYGTGHRIALSHTRAMVRAALDGRLDDVATEPDPVFGVHVPTAVPDVPDTLLRPRETWDDPADYDEKSATLARMFADNFDRFSDHVPEAVTAAGPRV